MDNGLRTIQTVGRIGWFCTRHFLAFASIGLAACAIWTLFYAILLIWAVLEKGDPGGPLTYPFGLLFFFLAGVAISLVLLCPSTIFAEWLASRLGLPAIVQIPLSIANLAVICIATPCVIAATRHQGSLYIAAWNGGILFLMLLLPLGLYWWVAQLGPFVFTGLRWLRSSFAGHRAP